MNIQSEVTQHSEFQLKSTFDESFGALRDNDGPTEPEAEAPPLRRHLVIHISPANFEKTVLDSAAKALAELWKVAPPSRVTSGRRTARHGR